MSQLKKNKGGFRRFGHIQLGLFSEVLSKYPYQRESCARALMEMGRFNEVLSEYPDQKTICAGALIKLKRFKEVLEYRFRITVSERKR